MRARCLPAVDGTSGGICKSVAGDSVPIVVGGSPVDCWPKSSWGSGSAMRTTCSSSCWPPGNSPQDGGCGVGSSTGRAAEVGS